MNPSRPVPHPDDSGEDPRKNLEELLRALAATRMPFGKYGPKSYPPDGLPLHQLPAEYLLWFRRQGFPKGKLGGLLEALSEIHLTGAEAVLNPLRKAGENPPPLRKPRPKTFDFRDSSET